MKKILLVILFVVAPLTAWGAYGDTTTFFSKVYWGDGKDQLTAIFDFPEDVASASDGSFVIADTYNNVIREITAEGTVAAVAGTGSYGDTTGSATSAEFALPSGVAASGNAVYVADTENGAIKKISDGQVTTLVSGLNKPAGVAVYNNTVYFLDTGNNALKKVSTNGGTVSTITTALSAPKKLDITDDGVYAYVANSGSYQVKRVTLSSGAVSTTAGSGTAGSTDGSCSQARFENVWGVHVVDDIIYVSDGDGTNDTVRAIDLSGCTVSTFASDANMISINYPNGLTSYNGNLYVAATGIGIIQRYALADANDNELFAGAIRFNVRYSKPALTGNPKFMVLSKNKKTIYYSENNRIRKLRRGSRKSSAVIAGSVVDNYNTEEESFEVGQDARFSDIPSFALSKNGEVLYVVDRNNNRIREVELDTKRVTYLTGAGKYNMYGGEYNDFSDGGACVNEFDTGVAGCAYFSRPTGSVLSKDGNYLYVADSGNNRIRRVTLTGSDKGNVITIAGGVEAGFADGVGTAAKFSAPFGVALSKKGNSLLVADRDNQRIRKIHLGTREVSTVAGTGANGYLDAALTVTQFSYPEWITRGTGGVFYISEVGGQRIRLIDRKNNVSKLVAGNGERGFKNGSRTTAEFNNPRGMLVLPNKLLVAELLNDQIRAIDIRGEAPYTEAAPDIVSVSPSTLPKEWYINGTTAAAEIHGSNFRHGAVVYVGPYKATTFVQSSSSLAIQLPEILEMETGNYTVRVLNSDGQSDQLIRGLGISQNGSVPNVDFWPE